MNKTLLILCFLFELLQGAMSQTGLDTSNYKLLIDVKGGNFSHYAALCRGELISRILNWVNFNVTSLFGVQFQHNKQYIYGKKN